MIQDEAKEAKKTQVALTEAQWAALCLLADMGLAYVKANCATLDGAKLNQARRVITDGAGAMLEINRSMKPRVSLK